MERFGKYSTSCVRSHGSQSRGTRGAPLTSLERYMLADDSPAYPRTFVVCLEFDGPLDRPAFERSLRQCLAEEPRLTSQVRRTWLMTPNWEPQAPAAVVEWPDAEPVDLQRGRRIDLTREPGLRVIATPSADGSRMYHVFHHACCDGIGALAFLGRLYAAYSRILRPDVDVMTSPIDVKAFEQIEPADDLSLRMGSAAEAARASRRRTWEVLTRPPARLTAPRRAGADAGPTLDFPGSLTRVIDHRATRDLKRAARSHCATLNDLLLASMFRAIWTWNRDIDPSADRARFQLMAPVDLRSPQHDLLPAANLVSCVFVTQHGRDCSNPDQLLTRVAERMRYAVATRSALILSHAIRRLARVPGLLELALRLWRTQATGLVSYVGDAGKAMRATFPQRRGRMQIGDLELRQITATGPIRPGTGANLTGGLYAGELVLNLTLDPHQFARRDADRMLTLVVENLLAYAMTAGRSELMDHGAGTCRLGDADAEHVERADTVGSV